MKKIIAIALLVVSALVPAMAQNFLFVLSKMDSHGTLDSMNLSFDGNKVKVESLLFVSGNCIKNVLASGIVDFVNVASPGLIAFYDKNGKVICAVGSKNNGCLNTIAYKKDGQTRGAEINEKDDKFLETFNRLNQWIKDNNGKPSLRNIETKQTTSVPKRTITAKRDPNLIKLIERPMGIDIAGGKATAKDILKQSKKLGLPKPDVDADLSLLMWDDNTKIQIQNINYNVSLFYIEVNKYEILWGYWFDYPNKEKTLDAVETIRAALEASGIDMQELKPYNEKYICSFEGMHAGRKVMLNGYCYNNKIRVLLDIEFDK